VDKELNVFPYLNIGSLDDEMRRPLIISDHNISLDNVENLPPRSRLSYGLERIYMYLPEQGSLPAMN